MKKSLFFVLPVLMFLLYGCESQNEPLSVSKKQLFLQVNPIFDNPSEELLASEPEVLYIIDSPEQLAQINTANLPVEIDFRKNCIVYTSCIREYQHDYICLGAYSPDSAYLTLDYYPTDMLIGEHNKRTFVWAIYPKFADSGNLTLKIHKRDRIKEAWSIFGINEPKEVPWIAERIKTQRAWFSESVLRDTTTYEVLFAYHELEWRDESHGFVYNIYYDRDGVVLAEFLAEEGKNDNKMKYKSLGNRIFYTCL